MLPGAAGFVYSPVAARTAIVRAWPELAETAIAQAVARLGRLVSGRHAKAVREEVARMAICHGDAPDTRPYLHRY